MNTNYQHIKPKFFSSPRPGPHLLIIGGVHGDEYEPMRAVERIIGEFHKDNILKCGRLTLVPVVNEPANQRDARCGPDGLDLARTCPGDKQGSVTEKIAWEISDLIRTVDYLIDMHTGGKMFQIYPLSGYVLHSDPDILNQQRRMSRAFGLPVQWGTSPALEGRTLSVARDANIPAIYTEYGGGGPSRPEIVDALYHGCMNVLVDLEMIPDQDYPINPPEYIVEDHRPESGHLQILYPAPASGRITYLVALGAQVHRHQPIARISPSDNSSAVEVVAGDEGLVFLINRQMEVAEVTSMLGILPITQPGKITIS